MEKQKAIRVRQHPALITVWFLFCACGVLFLGYEFLKYESWTILLALPFLLVFIYVFLYFQKWEIVFERDKIVVSVFLHRLREYSYYHISEASEWYSYVEHGYVMRLLFSDGRHIQFSHIFTNYQKAKLEIMRHKSIADADKGKL